MKVASTKVHSHYKLEFVNSCSVVTYKLVCVDVTVGRLLVKLLVINRIAGRSKLRAMQKRKQPKKRKNSH